MRTDKSFVLKRMARVRELIMEEMRTNGDGKFGRGLSSEGFAGGYLQALDDIDGALCHGSPSDHRGYWRRSVVAKPEGPKKRLRKCPKCASKTEARHFERVHSCPFQNDIGNDPTFRCNCCSACQDNCCDSI